MKNRFPKGWDEKRVKAVLEHYESQTELEAIAEDEASFELEDQRYIEVPKKLLPKIRELISHE